MENVGSENCWVRSIQRTKITNIKYHKIMLQSIQLRTSENQGCDGRVKTSHFNNWTLCHPSTLPRGRISNSATFGYPESFWNCDTHCVLFWMRPDLFFFIILNRVNPSQPLSIGSWAGRLAPERDSWIALSYLSRVRLPRSRALQRIRSPSCSPKRCRMTEATVSQWLGGLALTVNITAEM